MHLFVRAYSISNSQPLRNCFVVSEGLSWLLFRPFCHPWAFSCFCLLGDRMGTGRGNQEVLSEQRQNRGNLNPAPNYNTSCQRRLAYREAILISSGCCGEGPMGLAGGLCTEQLFQTLQSGVVFPAVKRKGKVKRGKMRTRQPAR